MQGHKLVLSYWDIRGLAERIRLVLEYLGTPYEDKRITDGDEWFKKIKPSINDPFINLPYLADGDKIISESEAVLYYVIIKAGKTELFGKTPDDKVEVVKLRSAFNDLYSTYVRTVYSGGDWNEKKPGLIESLKPHLTKFQKYLGTKDFFVGELTFVDIVIADFLDVLSRLDESLLKDHFPHLDKLRVRVWDLPAIAKYRDSRFKPMPCNGPSAIWGAK